MGKYLELYTTINSIAFFVLLIFNLSKLKIKTQNLSNLSLKLLKNDRLNQVSTLFSNNTFWASIEIILISCVQYLPGKSLNFGFGRLVGTGLNYFGLLFFIPYIIILFCWLIRVDPLFQIDLITPAFPLALSVSKIACFCAGCCIGFESTIGLYNSLTHKFEFPIQLLESGVALLIFIFLILCKNKFKPGTMLPFYTIIYSLIRFFTEFLRGEPNIILGLKIYQVLCIIGVLVSFIELFIIKKFGNKIKKACTSDIKWLEVFSQFF